MPLTAIQDIVRVSINIINPYNGGGGGGGPTPPEPVEDDVIISAIANTTLAVGDCVCVAPDGRVTLALTSALTLAGGVLGVVTVGGASGATVKVQVDGKLDPPNSTVASFGPVDCDPATGHQRVVSTFAPDAYPLGFSNALGYVTMCRGLALNTHGAYAYNQDGGLIADYNADLETAGVLATWTDRSGSLNHLTQATGANQPLVVAGVLNGKKVVRFDGTNDSLAKTSFALNSNEFTAYVVSSLAAVGSNPMAIYYNGGGCIVNYAGTSGQPSCTRQGGVITYALNVVGAGFAIRSSQMRNDGTNELFYQGVSRGTVTDATAIPTTGAAIGVGALSNGAGFWMNGDIARILIYNKRHTTAVRQAIEAQLALDYAL